ncbi:HEAT repeat domain-containing protein [Photobacterium sp. 1_MG-2023]|uniref:HEAT repeat domain-containing protein n=1 Tax=Photobacterium sp. 1_MG-2023 TaxID=3062646 RepID=UPI0026E2D0F3|nr:HEAT repeat domain-containing protein [Photobacterium sp. 1_MG-2023]MDO6705086.1 hypothetical protein [Photobacterium sp. 1_MG-2023]
MSQNAMKNKFLILSLIVCAVAGAAFYSWMSTDDVSGTPQTAAALTTEIQATSSPQDPMPVGLQVPPVLPLSQKKRPGQDYSKLSYAMLYQGDIAFSAPGTQIEQTIHFSVAGQLVQYRQIQDTGIYHLLRMTAPEVSATIGQQPNPEIVAAVKSQMQTGIEMLTTPEGEILEVYLSEPHSTLKSMETVAFLMQNIVPESISTPEQWQRSEQDYNGEFTAFYSLKKEDTGTDVYQLFKQRELEKALYDQARGLEKQLTASYTFSHEASWNQAHRFLNSLSVDEEVRHQMNNVPLASSRNQLTLTLSEWSPQVSAEDLALIQQVQAQRSIQLSAAEVFQSATGNRTARDGSVMNSDDANAETEADAQANRVSAEAAYQEIQALYDEMLALDGLERVKAENQLSTLLQDFARTYPDQLDLVTDDLRQFSPQEPGFSLYLSALSTVSSRPAQDAMLTTLNARMNENQAAASIMAALALSPQGNTLTFERFSNMVDRSPLSDNLSANVDLAKSAMVQRMGVEDTATADQYVASQLQKLKASEDTSATMHQLTVLGNMGQYLSFSDLQQYTEQPNETIRQQATHALRFVPGNDATSYLMDTLKDGGNSATREVAANSLSYRSLDNSTLTQIQQQIDVEQNQQIKERLQGIVDKYATPEIAQQSH